MGLKMQKDNVTDTQKAQAIIISSYMLYLIDGLMDKKGKSFGSTINLKQKLFSQTRNAQNLDYVKLSNEAWMMTVDKYKNENYRIMIGHAIERFYFDNERVLELMYGRGLVDLVWRFTCKQLGDDKIDHQIIKETNIVMKDLTESMRKVIFDYFKNIKG